MAKRTTLLASALLTLCATQTAQANIQVDFVESAPKDSFVISNIGTCDLTNVRFEIDLRTSQGKLIFDTTAAGEGVEVFQPFEVKSGELSLATANSVNDGDKKLSVVVENLAKNNSVSFTIDVDDTLPKSELGQIRVTGSEMQGAQVRWSDNTSSDVVAIFSAKNSATILLPACA